MRALFQQFQNKIQITKIWEKQFFRGLYGKNNAYKLESINKRIKNCLPNDFYIEVTKYLKNLTVRFVKKFPNGNQRRNYLFQIRLKKWFK